LTISTQLLKQKCAQSHAHALLTQPNGTTGSLTTQQHQPTQALPTQLFIVPHPPPLTQQATPGLPLQMDSLTGPPAHLPTSQFLELLPYRFHTPKTSAWPSVSLVELSLTSNAEVTAQDLSSTLSLILLWDPHKRTALIALRELLAQPKPSAPSLELSSSSQALLDWLKLSSLGARKATTKATTDKIER